MSDQNGILTLNLLDVYRNRLGETVDVMLRHQTLSHTPVFRDLDASKSIKITKLHAVPQGLYSIAIDPPSYLAVSQFVTVQDGTGSKLEIVFPIDSRKVTSVTFPEYANLAEDAGRVLESSDSVLGFEKKKGGELYAALDNIRRAGFLNVATKCSATRLSNDATVGSYIQNLYELRGDRFFALVPRELREETKNSVAEDIFEPADETLHHGPRGYENAGSFKTRDHYGNLQLSFFTNGKDWRADIDIDDAKGLEHVFQVLRNELTGRPTHPFDIQQILIRYQNLDPGYHLNLRD